MRLAHEVWFRNIEAIRPEPAGSGDEWFHADLGGKDNAELQDDRERLRLRALLGGRRSWWHTQRLELVEAELARRERHVRRAG